MPEPTHTRATAATIAQELEALRGQAGLDVLAHLLYCPQLEAIERSRHG
jgi:hypothetical protein